ncbi:hypothetical protein VTO42DRAFT_815 [Malbranchea cinnamomea]
MGIGDSSENHDPFNWTIDEVVQYLCYGSFDFWTHSKNPPPRPPASFLESLLRENDVTGDILLTEINKEFLQQNGLKSLGQRVMVVRAIEHLRQVSAKYKEIVGDQLAAPSSSTIIAFNQLGTPLTHSPWCQQQSPVPVAPPGLPPSTPVLNQRISLPPRPVRSDDSHHELLSELQSTRPRRNEHIVVDGTGRKRRRLTLAFASPATSTPLQSSRSKDWYIGPDKLAVSEVFYEGIAYQDDDDDDTFSFVRQVRIPSGKQLFVKQKMQHYLQQPLQEITRDGKKAFAIFPYNGVQGLKIPHYFTLFATDKNGVTTATKEDLNDWPDLADSASSFHYLLQKYPPKLDEDHDDIDALPLYGDSASEDGYDSETWQEIESEKREKTTDRTLSAVELDEIIDECICKFVENWHATKRASEERKAKKLWTQSRANKTKHSEIRAAASELERLGNRLRMLRRAIKDNQWSKEEEVRQQCQSMEHSVFDRERLKWKISVLELDQCPPGPSDFPPSKKPKPPSKPVEDEESLESDESFNEDDGDFIVPDDGGDFERNLGSVVIQPDNQPETEENIVVPRRRRSSPLPQSQISASNNIESHVDSKVDISPHPAPLNATDDNKPTSDVQPRKQGVVVTDSIEVVDLTKDSDEEGAKEAENGFEVHTPPLNPSNEGETPDIELKLAPNSVCPPADLPDHTDVEGIRRLSWAFLEERNDRRRLLVKLIFSISDEEREGLKEIVGSLSYEIWHDRTLAALRVLSEHGKTILDMDEIQSKPYMRMATFFVSWINCKKLSSKGILKEYIKNALRRRSKKKLCSFHPELTEALRIPFTKPVSKSKIQNNDNEEPRNKSRDPPDKPSAPILDGSDPEALDGEGLDEDILDRESLDGETLDGERRNLLAQFIPSPRRKRKRAVKQSREAMDTQRSAQRRVEQQEEMQKRLARKLGSMGFNGERQAVSFDEPVIYLHPSIGGRVKPHQLNGIQFMWRELIKDPKQQGCLLAHTMGLGKTMQVISLLVTIANAANSLDPGIRNQVPENFRRSRTLVLCPSSLIENWWEEFWTWVPNEPQTHKNLGKLRKIPPTVPHFERLREISKWYSHGGVLLISYDIFRTLVLNPSTNARPAALSPEEHAEVRKQLLEGPNIIVADEAHKMKNQSSGIAQACAQFRSKSRIALTGSPLANNLTDYYAMINWISPGYLGNFVQFKAKYIEPIEDGLYVDSTPAERRRSLKKLQVLKKDLDPKVNRHDITALEGSLPPKVEFVITVPLTEVQEKAYRISVSDLLGGDVADAGNARILACLGHLSILCNHPACFLDELKASSNGLKKAQQLAIDSDSEVSPTDNTPASKLLSPGAMAKLRGLLEAIEDLESPTLSHRIRILEKIIEESIKAGDKLLIFSHSLLTLNYIERRLKRKKTAYSRLDGKTPISSRQAATKAFNHVSSNVYVFLISTTAGGLGLNIPGANRVILVDFRFNPTWEEQAVGRAYRFGQTKPVYVYHFVTGGTFEDVLHNKTVFKLQLASRVVDKKNPVRWAMRNIREYLFPPKTVEQEDLSEFHGKDVVLDRILAEERYIRKIVLTETFQREDNDKLTAEEEKDVQEELEEQRMQRDNPTEWARRIAEKETAMREKYQHWHVPYRPPHNAAMYPMAPPPVPLRSAQFQALTQLVQSAFHTSSQPLALTPDRSLFNHAVATPSSSAPDMPLNGENLVSTISGSNLQVNGSSGNAAASTFATLVGDIGGLRSEAITPSAIANTMENQKTESGNTQKRLGSLVDGEIQKDSTDVEMLDADGPATEGIRDTEPN